MDGVEEPGVTKVLAQGSVARLTSFHHHRDRPHSDPDEEVMPRPALIFTSAGRWGFCSARGRVDVTPRQVLLVNAGDTYRCGHDSRFPADRTLCVEIDAHPDFRFDRSWVPFSHAWGSLLTRMATEGRIAAPGHRLAIDGLASRLVVEAARSNEESGATPEAVQVARAFLEMSFRHDVGLKDVAEAAATSAFHLTREFKRHVGETPRQYLIRLRIREAKTLLRDTAATVTQVAHACGFNSVSHFSTTFRTRAGCTPSAFRRQPQA